MVQQTDNRPVQEIKGEIVYEGVNFRYSEQEKVLQNFNLRIAPGESIALVGHTGAGKSSLVKLITRFYEFQGGEIYIDGQNIRSFDLHSYRKQLGIVSQVPFLFSGSVADNIRYARPDMTLDEIEAVARRVGDGEWLETLPNGLQTDVGRARHPPIYGTATVGSPGPCFGPTARHLHSRRGNGQCRPLLPNTRFNRRWT